MKIKDLIEQLQALEKIEPKLEVKIACGPDIWTKRIYFDANWIQQELKLIDNPTVEEIEWQS